jgi:hypothetical protein
VDEPLVVDNIKVVDGVEDGVIMTVTAHVFNRADVAIHNIGRMNLTVALNGATVGYAIANDDVTLDFGKNVIQQTVHIIRTEQNVASINKLLSDYSSGIDIEVTLHGNAYSTPLKLLKTAMEVMTTESVLSGLIHQEDKLFGGVYTRMISADILTKPDPYNCSYTKGHLYSDVTVFAYNPFDTPMMLDDCNINVTWMGAPSLGFNATYFANGQSTDIGLVIPPKTLVPFMQRLCLSDNLQSLVSLLSYLQAIGADLTGHDPFTLEMIVAGQLWGDVNNFKGMKIDYYQDHLLTVGTIVGQ